MDQPKGREQVDVDERWEVAAILALRRVQGVRGGENEDADQVLASLAACARRVRGRSEA
ncbi:hypothetical protein TRAPUB_4714 [Trametes pubescens]|uniref:Uncharacterized protein n=1 Tax=Trametes pubescens TaxID=154538 RepID=A0A1M2VA02_TRAPU|nr:hypothetical protein TRAPUB_4714 [Trametes pubescens]